MAEKKNLFFGKIETAEDALKMVKDASMAFYFLAGLLAILSFFIGFGVLADAAIYGLCAFFISRFKSRVASIILLLLAIVGCGVTLANAAGANLGGGRNVILSIAIVYTAIRATEAVFKLNGRFSSPAVGESTNS